MRREALEYMARDRLQYVDMLEIMRRCSDRVIYADRDGVLLRDEIGGAYIMSAETRDAAQRMLDTIENPYVMEVHQDFIVPMVEERFGLGVDMECYQSAYGNAEPPGLLKPPALEENELPIRQLDMSALDTVAAIYPHNGPEYIESRIAAGEMYGAFDGREIAAFIGTHAEGAMGLLEVREGYKRRGLGSALFLYMTRRQLGLGRFPFSHIETDNAASMAMHIKYGWAVTDRPVYWLD